MEFNSGIAKVDEEKEERLEKQERGQKKPRDLFEKEDIEEIDESYLQAIPPEMLILEEWKKDQHTWNMTFQCTLGDRLSSRNIVWEFRRRFRKTVSPEPTFHVGGEGRKVGASKELLTSKKNERDKSARMQKTD
jgi:hypothetical protein